MLIVMNTNICSTLTRWYLPGTRTACAAVDFLEATAARVAFFMSPRALTMMTMMSFQLGWLNFQLGWLHLWELPGHDKMAFLITLVVDHDCSLVP